MEKEEQEAGFIIVLRRLFRHRSETIAGGRLTVLDESVESGKHRRVQG